MVSATQVQYTLQALEYDTTLDPDLDLDVPLALAGKLRRARLEFYGDPDDEPVGVKVDLARFAECQLLEEVEVHVFDFKGEIRICGLDRLPAACKGVVLAPDLEAPGILVEPKVGWRFDVEGGLGGRIFVRRAEV